MLNQFPGQIKAGVSLKVVVETPDFLAPAWSVSVAMRGATKVDLSATSEGQTHTIAATAGATSGWGAGLYAVTVRATNGEDVVEIEAGQVEVLADVASHDAGHDARGHAQRVLAAIEATIEGRASKDQSGYTINGRTLQRTPIADLLLLRETYRKEVAKAKAGRPTRLMGRQVKVGFR